MQPSDIAHLNSYLQRLYGDRYAGITSEMGLIWYDKLKAFSLDLAQLAARRWASAHLPHQAPSLDQLAEEMETMETESRRIRAQRMQQQDAASWENRDDDYSSAEVRTLIRSVWPEMFPGTLSPLKGPAQEARMVALRQQVEHILDEERQ